MFAVQGVRKICIKLKIHFKKKSLCGLYIEHKICIKLLLAKLVGFGRVDSCYLGSSVHVLSSLSAITNDGEVITTADSHVSISLTSLDNQRSAV